MREGKNDGSMRLEKKRHKKSKLKEKIACCQPFPLSVLVIILSPFLPSVPSMAEKWMEMKVGERLAHSFVRVTVDDNGERNRKGRSIHILVDQHERKERIRKGMTW